MAPNPAPDSELQQVAFSYNGKPLSCAPGTSLAAALWNQGIRHLSHSHKYGRPRGVTCARGHCTNCLLRVDGVPNVRSCETPVHEGLIAVSQDTGTFYGAPMQKMLSLGSNWFPVGFYYKWFTKPASLSRFFLDRIRPMTGVGRLPDSGQTVPALPAGPVTGQNGKTGNLGHFATIIVGAGPSGLLAARKAAGPTLLVDDNPAVGGQRLAALRAVADHSDGRLARFPSLTRAYQRLTDAAEQAHLEQIRFMGQARVVGGFAPHSVLIRQNGQLQTATFDKLVWAAGALDTLGLFPGNDTPGLFGPRALYRLLTRDGLDVAGRHALLIGGGFDFWLSAALLAVHGANISLVVTESGCQAEVAAAVDLKWALNTGLKLDEIRPGGEEMVQAIFVPKRNAPGPRGSHMHLEADLVVLCERGKPAYDIPQQLGTALTLQPDRGGYLPPEPETATGTDLTLSVPGGAQIVYTGETLGYLPGEQVNR